MKAIEKKVYYCDHCSKHGLSASAMSVHEKFCRKNPNNRHKCFEFCTYLKRETEFVNSSYLKVYFTCEKLGKNLFSYKFEKAKHYYSNLETDGERMPLECRDYKYDPELEESRYETIYDDQDFI